MYLIEASATLTLGRSKSSLRRELSSCNLRSFRSAIDCFFDLASPPSRTAYAAGMVYSLWDFYSRLYRLAERDVRVRNITKTLLDAEKDVGGDGWWEV